MKQDNSSKVNLKKKILQGIERSGFPLEIKVARILSPSKWHSSIGSHYLDIETGKYRESDIVAEKTINGIKVHLFIECKKSVEKQLVLYIPSTTKTLFPDLNIYVKTIPRVEFEPKEYSDIKVFEAFNGLKIFDKQFIFAQNAVFSRGDKIEQDNTDFYSSLNGLIKRSIFSSKDGYAETGLRTIYLYMVVWDGLMYSLSTNKSDELSLNECSYGQLEFEYHIRPLPEYSQFYKELLPYFYSNYIIEIIAPSILKNHLSNIEQVFQNIDKSLLQGWGEDWRSFL